MVRVISVHHFADQNVLTVEQPTASVIASPHRLLLALPSHCIEVRDLSHGGEVLFTFPTVDEVTQIVHCLNGKAFRSSFTVFRFGVSFRIESCGLRVRSGNYVVESSGFHVGALTILKPRRTMFRCKNEMR